jgi:hypothetical protein
MLAPIGYEAFCWTLECFKNEPADPFIKLECELIYLRPKESKECTSRSIKAERLFGQKEVLLNSESVT